MTPICLNSPEVILITPNRNLNSPKVIFVTLGVFFLCRTSNEVNPESWTQLKGSNEKGI